MDFMGPGPEQGRHCGHGRSPNVLEPPAAPPRLNLLRPKHLHPCLLWWRGRRPQHFLVKPLPVDGFH